MGSVSLVAVCLALVCLACAAPDGGSAGRSQDVLRLLREQGADLREPRHALFYLYFRSQHNANGAAEAIRQTAFAKEPNFKVTVRPSETDWLVLAEAKTLIDERTVPALDKQFDEIARASGGMYDGWEAALE